MNLRRVLLGGLFGIQAGLILLLLLWVVHLSMKRYVPEYPTVTRVCVEGDDFSPISVIIDGEEEILPCNDPVSIYPKAER